MEKKDFTLRDIAISLYNSTEDELNETSSTQESYRKLRNNILKEFHDKLVEKLSYDEFEEAFNLVLQYGEFTGQEQYADGFTAGVRVCSVIGKA